MWQGGSPPNIAALDLMFDSTEMSQAAFSLPLRLKIAQL